MTIDCVHRFTMYSIQFFLIEIKLTIIYVKLLCEFTLCMQFKYYDIHEIKNDIEKKNSYVRHITIQLNIEMGISNRLN